MCAWQVRARRHGTFPHPANDVTCALPDAIVAETRVLLHNVGIEATGWAAAIGSADTRRMRLRAPKSLVSIVNK
jgi:hypothetical protein